MWILKRCSCSPSALACHLFHFMQGLIENASKLNSLLCHFSQWFIFFSFRGSRLTDVSILPAFAHFVPLFFPPALRHSPWVLGPLIHSSFIAEPKRDTQQGSAHYIGSCCQLLVWALKSHLGTGKSQVSLWAPDEMTGLETQWFLDVYGKGVWNFIY